MKKCPDIFNIKKTVVVLLSCCLALSVISCETPDKQNSVKDRLGQSAIGIPSIGTGRFTGSNNGEDSGKGITICVDPGHGFDDVGATSEYLPAYEEKQLTLMYAELLRDELKKLGYTVIMTHDGQQFPVTEIDDGNNKFNPYERAAYANTQDIDYFVSLHCDSFEEDSNVGGTRIYFCDTENKKETYSEAVANSIQSYLCKAFPDEDQPKVHNMKSADAYVVCKNTTAPASLIEVGFITNAEDAAKIVDSEWRSAFVKGVAEGIDAYFSMFG